MTTKPELEAPKAKSVEEVAEAIGALRVAITLTLIEAVKMLGLEFDKASVNKVMNGYRDLLDREKDRDMIDGLHTLTSLHDAMAWCYGAIASRDIDDLMPKIIKAARQSGSHAPRALREMTAEALSEITGTKQEGALAWLKSKFSMMHR